MTLALIQRDFLYSTNLFPLFLRSKLKAIGKAYLIS